MTSFLDWASNLPPAWEAKPLRAVADYTVSNVDKVPADTEAPVRLCNYTDVYNNEFITLELDLMRATATEVEIQKFGLKVDDVVITKDSESWDDIGVSALVKQTAGDLVCGYHLAVLRPRKQILDGSFLFRCLQAKPVRVQLELAANGVTRFGIPKADIGAMTLPIPPLPQQRTIADYLDRETARLDSLVAAKERLLGLLAEKRRALITRAVTRGIEPRGPLRDSGIPWLGEIPAHWEALPIKHGFDQIGSGTTPPTGMSEYYDGDVPWVTTSELRENVIQATNQTLTHAALDDFTSLRAYPGGSLLFAMYGATIGRVALLGIEATVNQAVCVMAKPTRLDPEFAFYAFQASREHLIEQASGGGQPNLNAEKVREHRVACPPLVEQRSIVAHIGAETVKLDTLRSATERTIALLKERRAALIAAVVTGNIDVQGTGRQGKAVVYNEHEVGRPR